MTQPETRGPVRADPPTRYLALDGFRGVFILLVLLYHFGVTSLAGGWIGINHFFVFSGFLIARMLIRERQRTGRLNVLGFYQRRARRIVPAMALLVAAVVVHTWLVEQPAQRAQFGGDAVATLGFFLNWRLIGRDDAYFDMLGHPSPLRHAWTLSVEEQFYLLVPFLILATCWLTRRRLGRAAVPAALALLSAWWTARLGLDSIADYPRLYYGTDTRAQALLVGVAAAFVLGIGADGRRPAVLPRAAVEAIAWVGLAISLSAFFVLQEDTAWVFNNGGMLLFALAAALIGIAAVDDRDLLINRVFAWAPLAYLGRISYGLYLYHWPIRLWLPLDGWPPLLAGGLQLGLSVLLAAVSFRFVEAPIMLSGVRGLLRGWGRTARRLVPASLVAAITAGALALWSTAAPAIPANLPTLVAGQPPYVAGSQQVRSVLVGDSVAASLATGWQPERYRDLRLENQSAIGCDLMTTSVVRDGQVQATDPACTAWSARWPRVAADTSAAHVVLVADTHFLTAHQGPAGPAQPRTPELARLIDASLDRVWSQARASGVRSLSVLNLPCRRIDAKRLDPQLRFFAAEGSDDASVQWANGVIARWAARTSGVRVLDLYGQLCRDGFQPQVRGVDLYHDTLHFTPAAAAMIWGWVAPTMRQQALSAGAH